MPAIHNLLQLCSVRVLLKETSETDFKCKWFSFIFLYFFLAFCCWNGSLHIRCQLFFARCQMGWSIASASKLSEDVDNSEVSHDPIKLNSRSKYDGSGDCWKLGQFFRILPRCSLSTCRGGVLLRCGRRSRRTRWPSSTWASTARSSAQHSPA